MQPIGAHFQSNNTSWFEKDGKGNRNWPYGKTVTPATYILALFELVAPERAGPVTFPAARMTRSVSFCLWHFHEKMASEEKSPDPWPVGLQLKSPPYTLHSSLEGPAPPGTANRKLVILTVGAASVLTISIVGVLLATYLGRAGCVQRDPFGFLPPQVNVQNEASLLLALSELGEQGVTPGITCDLRNHLMVYHGQPEGCVTLKMEASEPLPSCEELEAYFHAVLRNATLGIAPDVQLVESGSLGSLAALLCSTKPVYLVHSFGPSPRHLLARFA
ncbi:hypothetical protein JRQ81_009197 [Phrynocephalus forsythii]|uniref:Uncharacterized protein n=1 Tax=Phrynocephalus forsythii TaxID=171643 RepID=A0A9Q1ARY1_9SAUR|nr:hypothetical protein JRQ81_009197 [Phrynocephalus forsythii]